MYNTKRGDAVVTFKRIRELREDRDKKQSEIANLLRVRQSTYSKYELGKICVPVEVLMKLAAYYNTSVDYLVDQKRFKQEFLGKKK